MNSFERLRHGRLSLIAILMVLIIAASSLVYMESADAAIKGKNPPEIGGRYAVLIGVDANKIIGKAKGYSTVVIEGQTTDASIIKKLKDSGKTVYSYLSIGSLENYRPYYEEFKDKTLAPYENWDEEFWMDVSDKGWQKLITEEILPDLKAKGFDGLFLDNADVYYLFPRENIYAGLVSMIKAIKEAGLKVMINGGDLFVSKLIQEGKAQLIDSVNQECVYTTIKDYDRDAFRRQSKSDREYFTDYLKSVKKAGIAVYLLEYTKSKKLAKTIAKFCRKKGYGYCISDKVSLEG